MKKGQTAIEYLIILAVIIIIALVVFGMMVYNDHKSFKYNESKHDCIDFVNNTCIIWTTKTPDTLKSIQKTEQFNKFKQNNKCKFYAYSQNDNNFLCIQ